MLLDERADEGEKKLILTAEVAVKCLEGDSGFLDDVLRREADPLVMISSCPAARILDRGPASSSGARCSSTSGSSGPLHSLSIP